MPFDWKHYLDLARDLAQPSSSDQGQREAELRTAISRAYYSAFCHVAKRRREIAVLLAHQTSTNWQQEVTQLL